MIDLLLRNMNFKILSVDTTTNHILKMGGTEKRRKQPVEPASITKRTTLSADSNRKTESDGEQEMGECFLCGARDAALCKACGVVYVCPLHISYHQVDLIPPQSVLSFYFKQLEVFLQPQHAVIVSSDGIEIDLVSSRTAMVVPHIKLRH